VECHLRRTPSPAGEHGHPANQAINVLRQHGHTDIAAGLREMCYAPFHRPLDLFNIT
jgi:hypothetical protein